MAFLGNIFKKKDGGTKVGNFFRSIAKTTGKLQSGLSSAMGMPAPLVSAESLYPAAQEASYDAGYSQASYTTPQPTQPKPLFDLGRFVKLPVLNHGVAPASPASKSIFIVLALGVVGVIVWLATRGRKKPYRR